MTSNTDSLKGRTKRFAKCRPIPLTMPELDGHERLDVAFLLMFGRRGSIGAMELPCARRDSSSGGTNAG
jgi:hypothetical protein